MHVGLLIGAFAGGKLMYSLSDCETSDLVKPLGALHCALSNVLSRSPLLAVPRPIQAARSRDVSPCGPEAHRPMNDSGQNGESFNLARGHPAATGQKGGPSPICRSARIPGHDVSLLDRNGPLGPLLECEQTGTEAIHDAQPLPDNGDAERNPATISRGKRDAGERENEKCWR
jgi:hypothetical protein